MSWQEFDDYMVYDEVLKVAVYWTTYGDNDQYFLSRRYDFEEDFLEPIEGTEEVLVNIMIDKETTLEDLINKTKRMV